LSSVWRVLRSEVVSSVNLQIFGIRYVNFTRHNAKTIRNTKSWEGSKTTFGLLGASRPNLVVSVLTFRERHREQTGGKERFYKYTRRRLGRNGDYSLQSEV